MTCISQSLKLKYVKTVIWSDFMEEKNKGNSSEGDTFKANAEAAKTIVDLAREALKFGKSSEEYIKADKQSTSEYIAALNETLAAINEEIKNTNDSDLKSHLYKQRQDILNRIETEKERQREFFKDSDKKDKDFSKDLIGIVTAVALGAGTIAAKLLIENKKS